MVRRFNWTHWSLAIIATLFFGTSLNAQYDNGAGASVVGGYPTGSAANCGCNAGCSFGYPGGDCCGGCAGSGHTGPLRQHAQHLWEIHKRDFARNQAWPRPFDCADRQLYHSIWNTMIDTGCRWNCVFSALHFDAETNELNEMGRAKVKAIVRNSPMASKYALVQNEGNRSVVESRLHNLQSAIDNWYGADTFVEIAIADMYPGKLSGARVESLNQLSLEETPAPVIPVASGTGSTSDVGVGQ